MDEAQGREKVENEDGCCGKTTFMEGFQSLIINRAPKQCAYACFFFFLKSMLHTVVFWGWLRRGYKFQLYLIVFPLLSYIWMALFLFQHDLKKTLGISFDLFFLLLYFLAGSILHPLPWSCHPRPFLGPSSLFPHIPLSNIVLTFQVPHSSGQHTNLPSQIPGLRLSTRISFIHTHTHTEAIN